MVTSVADTEPAKETVINDNFLAVGPAGYYGRDKPNETGLTAALFAGMEYVNGAWYSVAAATLSLTASSTNYVEINLENAGAAPAISFNTSGFTPGRRPIAEYTTDGSSITGYTDRRLSFIAPQQSPDIQSVAYAAAIDTDALAGQVVIVGQLTGNITVNAPTNPSVGAKLTYVFEQDGTGSRVVTWNAVFNTPTDSGGAAGETGAVTFVYNGTSWVQVGGALAWN